MKMILPILLLNKGMFQRNSNKTFVSGSRTRERFFGTISKFSSFRKYFSREETFIDSRRKKHFTHTHIAALILKGRKWFSVFPLAAYNSGCGEIILLRFFNENDSTFNVEDFL